MPLSRNRPPCAAFLLILGLSVQGLLAQDTKPSGPPDAEQAAENPNEPFRRTVNLSAGSNGSAVVVAEFLTHGALSPDGKNLIITDSKANVVPFRILQQGPGDFCRVALQPVARESTYHIDYGGPDRDKPPPPFQPRAGLLLTTYAWLNCDLNQLDAVEKAVATAKPQGSDFVPSVYHRYNPIDPAPAPFLSDFRGQIRIPSAGKYAFFTTSQDASFLFIDDKLVVAAPGWHGPHGDARFRGEVQLKAGEHAFRYLHAASGPDSCMVAAWQPPGADKPEPIPSAAFGSEQVAHLSTVGPFQGPTKRLPDMVYAITGEVPIVDSDQPLVRVQFQHRAGSSAGSRLRWDFGDGQSATTADPAHIYLHPGLYTVTLTPGQSTGLRMSNRIQVGRALVPEDPKRPGDQLGAYLSAIDSYNPLTLDPPAVLQLVRSFDQAGQLDRAVKTGQAFLASPRASEDEASTYALASFVLPLIRDRLDDPRAAFELAQQAAQALDRNPAHALEFESIALDLAINELLETDKSVPAILESASKHLNDAGIGPAASRFLRVQADLLARKGDRKAALEAYAKAQAAVPSRRNTVERNAWRGSYSRSVEAYLREQKIDEARDTLRHWEDEFPADRAEGYLPLLQARYAAARNQLDRAVTIAADLVAINPDSSYADRLLFHSAECEQKRNQTPRALAGLKALITDYPGSPLVPEARQMIERLQSAKPATPAPAATEPAATPVETPSP